ncbi:MAG: TonB-dependent receptor [Chitinophagaceae bacterium]|nr:TonB-dependent receptor [Chitinophagaceae bacterium]
MKKIHFIAAALFPLSVAGQTISGKVTGKGNEPLAGASVRWLGSKSGIVTNEKGTFQIAKAGKSDNMLIATFVGYLPDTLSISTQSNIVFTLKLANELSAVVVEGQRSGVLISDTRPIKTEQITATELKKAACCDLAGCFETQTTVQPQTTNVVVNSKELRILGLAGVYNQILVDGFPLIQGLTYTYGISSIPGTLVNNIYVAKGANSVLQGFESISGQINVETKEPDRGESILLNAYMNNFGERHLNGNFSFRKKKWSNMTTVHMVQPANKIDRDDDQFLDLPLLTRYLISNKWKYGNENAWGLHSRIGIRYLQEKRIGGQIPFEPAKDKGSNKVYGQFVNLNQPEIWTKTGYRFNDQHSITGFVSAFQQQQESFFGTVKYDARQNNFYANLQYELRYGNNDLKTGISFRHLTLRENVNFTDTLPIRTYQGNYHRTENIPGIFAENTLRMFNDRLTWIAGIRADQHNQFGMYVTPRTLIKYDVTPRLILRANIGTGWRTVNLFSENIGLLVSSRNIIFTEALQPERALNMGINLTHKFESKDKNITGYISADFYRTNFHNQVFPDYDTDPSKAIIQNFYGTSISNGFQTEVYLNFSQQFEIKTGFNFLDVYRIEKGEKRLLPFNPRHKVLNTISYQPLSKKYHFDMNIHWYGQQRLPDTRSNPVAFQRPDFSQPFTLVNAQFTYNFKTIELYGGCENIFDFRQRQPIISWQNPFSPFFDTSSVWGPTRGRELYVGVRFKIDK